MIDVTRILNTNGVVIELNDGEFESLLEALDFYMSDMDRNESSYWYKDLVQLRDKIKKEMQ